MDNNDQDEQLSWSFPKILVGLIILGVLGWFGYQNRQMVLDYVNSPSKQVAGASTVKQSSREKVAVPHIDLQEKINTLAQEVTNLDVKEVASTSPQVQKVLHDMEALKNLPQAQAKDACMKICSGL